MLDRCTAGQKEATFGLHQAIPIMTVAIGLVLEYLYLNADIPISPVLHSFVISASPPMTACTSRGTPLLLFVQSQMCWGSSTSNCRTLQLTVIPQLLHGSKDHTEINADQNIVHLAVIFPNRPRYKPWKSGEPKVPSSPFPDGQLNFPGNGLTRTPPPPYQCNAMLFSRASILSGC